jgi:Zn-finger nucleic acid-binding protein
MKCPHCQIPLVKAKRQNVTIDYCTDCRGIWLDRGELDKIIQQSLHHPIIESERDLLPVDNRLFNDEFGKGFTDYSKKQSGQDNIKRFFDFD